MNHVWFDLVTTCFNRWRWGKTNDIETSDNPAHGHLAAADKSCAYNSYPNLT